MVIRVRPPLPREMSGEVEFRNVIHVDDKEQLITISENLEAVLDDHGQLLANPGPYSTHTFVFDHVYDQVSSQKKVFETTARAVVDSALQGYNATIFAYGQTGTGESNKKQQLHLSLSLLSLVSFDHPPFNTNNDQ